eukprot:683226-Rhodomonas_salina.1
MEEERREERVVLEGNACTKRRADRKGCALTRGVDQRRVCDGDGNGCVGCCHRRHARAGPIFARPRAFC